MAIDQAFEVTENKILSNDQCLYFATNAVSKAIPKRFVDTLYYSSDVEDGKMALGRSAVVQELTFEVAAGTEDTMNIVYSTEETFPTVEEIKADAGLDIGFTLIGMHLKKVAVPLRLENNKIGEAMVLAARTRPKFIGGARAVYDENLL